MADREGVRFVVVLYPLLWDLDENHPLKDVHEKVAAECARLGCECLDLLPAFVREGRPARSFWAHPTDPHPNREAHEIAARAIAERLWAMGWVATHR